MIVGDLLDLWRSGDSSAGVGASGPVGEARPDPTRTDPTRPDTTRHDTTWHDMIWYHIAFWYDIVVVMERHHVSDQTHTVLNTRWQIKSSDMRRWLWCMCKLVDPCGAGTLADWGYEQPVVLYGILSMHPSVCYTSRSNRSKRNQLSPENSETTPTKTTSSDNHEGSVPHQRLGLSSIYSL